MYIGVSGTAHQNSVGRARELDARIVDSSSTRKKVLKNGYEPPYNGNG